MRKTIIIAITTLSAMLLNAQSRHEFSISASGGLSSLQYDLVEGNNKLGFGGNIGLDYVFFFSKHFGIRTGAELSLYNSKGTLANNFLNSYSSMDISAESYEQRYYLSNFEETQKALFVNIPLMVQYQTGEKHKFYLAAGAKLGIPVNVKYESSASSISSTGYYAAQNTEYGTQEFLGFGQLQGKKSDGSVHLKLSAMVSLETGMKWRLSEKLALYTGIYADYGLNNIADTDMKPFIVREGIEKDYFTNALFESQYDRNSQENNLIDDIRPLSVGLKLRLSFGVGVLKNKKQEVPEVVIERIPIIETPSEVVVEDDSEAHRKAVEETARLQAEAAEIAEKEAKVYAQAQEDISQPMEDYPVGSSALSTSQKESLESKVELLKQYPHLKITCIGHTCNIGTSESNIRVGLERAEVAKAYLVEQGIDPDRIEISSEGDTSPIAPNDSEENRRLNRRVELVVNE